MGPLVAVLFCIFCVVSRATLDANMVLKNHNELRSAAGVPNAAWDPTLAKVAQLWAGGCSGSPSDNLAREQAYAQQMGQPWAQGDARFSVGENVGLATSNSPGSLIALWSSELLDWTCSTDQCTTECGHWKQMIWSTSTKIGCGYATCSPGGPFPDSKWYFLVCNYNQAGNGGGRSVPASSCDGWEAYIEENNNPELDKKEQLISLISNNREAIEQYIIDHAEVASSTLSAALGNSFVLYFSLDPAKDARNTANDIEGAVRDWASEQGLDFPVEEDDIQINIISEDIYKKREINHVEAEMLVGSATREATSFLLSTIFVMYFL